jgi:taurine transport system substrate-binding protein
MKVKAMSFGKTLVAAALGAFVLMIGAAQAANRTIVVGYQTDALPSSVAIANGDFDKATGAKIDFRRFNSGAEIFAAIASATFRSAMSDRARSRLRSRADWM